MRDRQLPSEIEDSSLRRALWVPDELNLPFRRLPVKCPRCNLWCSPEQVRRFGQCSRNSRLHV